MGDSSALSTGIAGLDTALGGLLVGDNVVWAHAPTATETVDAFESAFATATVTAGRRLIWVTGQRSPAELRNRFRPTEVVDARPGGPYTPDRLAAAILDAACPHAGAGVVVDALGPIAEAHGPAVAATLFETVCPRLFDAGPVACWRAPRAVLRKPALDRIEAITQCVVSVLAGRARIDKADGRPAAALETVLRVEPGPDGHTSAHTADDAAGVVAAALTRLCEQRGLSHGQLASLAGVGAPAISQALLGTHSLALDTILQLCDRAGIELSDFFATGPDPGYVLGRRDLSAPTADAVRLLDGQAAPVRVELVRLDPHTAAVPSDPHDRGQLVLVGSGLVKVTVGAATPVLRAGDALAVAERTTITGWENLADRPAGLFWVSRR